MKTYTQNGKVTYYGFRSQQTSELRRKFRSSSVPDKKKKESRNQCRGSRKDF